MNHDGEIDIYLGLDVGKGEHHGTALTPAGKRVFDKPMPNSESRLRDLFEKLQAKHGNVLVVVDQPASMGALPLAVARDTGCRVAYLPGLTMRRIADLYPGESKTDARDAAIIADAARTMPHTLRDLAPDGEVERHRQRRAVELAQPGRDTPQPLEALATVQTASEMRLHLARLDRIELLVDQRREQLRFQVASETLVHR